MSKFVRYLLIALGLNLLYVGICLLPLIFSQKDDAMMIVMILVFIFGGLSLFVQLIVGIVFAAGQRKDLGKAMLLTVGIFFLIGLSVCSGMLIGG